DLRRLIVPAVCGRFGIGGRFVFRLRHFQARAVTALAPAVLRVVGEEARIELREAAPAGRAGALRREDRWPLAPGTQHVDQALAEVERARERLVQRGVGLRIHVDLSDRELYRVLL